MKSFNRLIGFIVFSLVFLSCKDISSLSKETKPKIAIAGLAIESSTFSPATSDVSAFLARQGTDVFEYYPFLTETSPQRKAAKWIPTLRGHALPGGIVTRKAYDSLVNITLNLLEKNMPYDGLFFDIHGAMSVQGIDDPEGDFIQKIRSLIG